MSKFELRNIAIEPDDHEWLLALHNDPLVLRNITNCTPITMQDHMKWWYSIGLYNGYKIFAIDGNRAGLVKFYKENSGNNSCVLGADLHKDFRGKGLSKHMWALMLEKCFIEWKFHRVSLTTAEYNAPAIKLYTNLGFKYEGRKIHSLLRDGMYHDEICMYMLDKDYENP